MLINQSKWSRVFTLFLFITGIILPFLLVTYVHYYYINDVSTFRGWAECLEKNEQQIYLKCLPNPPNYPVVGLFLSAGTIQAIKSVFNVTDSKTLDFIFRHYLAFFDLFNFILFTRLASLMQFRFPIFVGLILLIVPSTLVGGAKYLAEKNWQTFMDNTWDGKPLCVGAQRLKAQPPCVCNFLCLPTYLGTN